MFDIGFLELVLIGIIGLIVLGPERLPIAARTLGRWIGRARKLVNQFTQEIDKQIEIEELKAQLKEAGESLDINKDVRQIQETVSQALKEAEHDADEFEPLPRKEPDQAFIDPNKPDSKEAETVSTPPSALKSDHK